MSARFSHRQPWIGPAWFDLLFLQLPPFLALLAVALLPPSLRDGSEVPLAAWVAVVLLVDVAHVYSTLFRTYFNRQRLNRQRGLYLLVPLCCYVAGVALYSAGALTFWRVLAYVAVYHFIRQQYGFFRLYGRKEVVPAWSRRLDAVAVYAATLYPLLHWHLSPGRHFSWFMEGDFLQWQAPWLKQGAGLVYLGILLAYVVKEGWLWWRGHPFNLPKNGILAGTALSWYFGIVYFNGDLAFTMLNVLSHGIPYMALVWLTARREGRQPETGRAGRLLARRFGLALFIGLIVVLAFVEEGFWDRWVWHERPGFFSWFESLPGSDAGGWLVWLVPLLSLPQTTHYVLDGFIWRRKDG
jgi:hypothetical protein